MAEKQTRQLDETEVLKILHKYNPWWTGKSISKANLKEFKRRDYYNLEQQLADDKIVALIGARRVGKTTLMYQLIEKILSRSDPKNILFLILDRPTLHISIDNLEKIFEIYATNILKESFDSVDDTIYIFLDEIQSLNGWQESLKSWWDMKYNIKFFISGSSSMDIKDGTSESLLGRINHQIVMPMKFLEFIRFREQETLEPLVNSINKKLRQAFKDSMIQSDPKIFFNSLTETKKELIPYQNKIESLLRQYVIKGGYPENAEIDDLDICGKNLRQYIELTLYKDIMKTGKIRDPVALENLFTILAKNSSNKINISDLSSSLDIQRSTLNTYLYLLESAFLIFSSEFYAQSIEKRKRTNKKIYVHDVGIRNISSSILDESVLQDSTEMGTILETVIADHTKRLKFNLESILSSDIFYWFSSHEVDLVMEFSHKPIPIEVKYRETVSLDRIQGIKKFNEKFKPNLSLVITKNQLELHNSIIFIPAWLYLLMC